MILKERIKNTETVLSTIFMIIFIIVPSILIVFSLHEFERNSKNIKELENLRIAMSFISTKFKQNDKVAGIELIEKDKLKILKIKNTIDQGQTITYIYFKDGYLYENLSEEDELDLELSEKIIKIKSFDMNKKGRLFSFSYKYENETIIQKLSLRSFEE